MTVSFVNERFDQRTGASTTATYPFLGHYNIQILYSGITYIKATDSLPAPYIQLTISGLYPDVKYITSETPPAGEEWMLASTIKLVRQYVADADPVEFVPHEDNPFQLKITNVQWFPPSGFPVIEAKLDGILYSKDDPQQSIEIHAAYGCR